MMTSLGPISAQPAQVHHADAAAHIGDSDIVGDKQVREIAVTLQVPEQVQDLRLHETSSDETGSSQMIIFRFQQGLAMLIRCCCPPEKSLGKRPRES